jgi:ribosomal protein S18 acetylase RimI-like enzyme
VISINESARPAGADDIEVIEALLEQVMAEVESQRGGTLWARREARARPARDDLLRSLDDESSLLIVGTIDDVVVGYSAIQAERLRDGALLATLTDLYVLPEARQVGVGEAMLDVCLEWARRTGCLGVDSLALPGDRHTKNFFESFGMVARAIVVHRSLGEDS